MLADSFFNLTLPVFTGESSFLSRRSSPTLTRPFLPSFSLLTPHANHLQSTHISLIKRLHFHFIFSIIILVFSLFLLIVLINHTESRDASSSPAMSCPCHLISRLICGGAAASSQATYEIISYSEQGKVSLPSWLGKVENACQPSSGS